MGASLSAPAKYVDSLGQELREGDVIAFASMHSGRKTLMRFGLVERLFERKPTRRRPARLGATCLVTAKYATMTDVAALTSEYVDRQTLDLGEQIVRLTGSAPIELVSLFEDASHARRSK